MERGRGGNVRYRLKTPFRDVAATRGASTEAVSGAQQTAVGLLCQRAMATRCRLAVGADRPDLPACVGERSGRAGGEGGCARTAFGRAGCQDDHCSPPKEKVEGWEARSLLNPSCRFVEKLEPMGGIEPPTY